MLCDIDCFISLLNVVLSLLHSSTVTNLTVHVTDHCFGEGDASTLSLAYQLPILSTVQEIQRLLMVVQFRLTCRHVTEDVVDDGYSLKAMVVVLRTLYLQISEFLHCLLYLLLFHQAQPEIILSLEVDLYKFLLQLSHVRRRLQLFLHLLG